MWVLCVVALDVTKLDNVDFFSCSVSSLLGTTIVIASYFKKRFWVFKTNEVDPFETCVLLFSGNLHEWQSLVLKLMTQIGSLVKVAVSFYCLTASLLDALVVG